MPQLTALRRAAPGRVSLELDGRPWRTVPDDVVVRAGLTVGLELDRPALRRIRSETARARGVAVAARALARRDLSAGQLDARLARARVAPSTAGEVVAALQQAGVVDDGRLACARARALADRGYGDAAIAARLETEGIEEPLVRDALAELAPEADRAQAVARRERDPRRAGRLLARRGFAHETVESVLGALDWDG